MSTEIYNKESRDILLIIHRYGHRYDELGKPDFVLRAALITPDVWRKLDLPDQEYMFLISDAPKRTPATRGDFLVTEDGIHVFVLTGADMQKYSYVGD